MTIKRTETGRWKVTVDVGTTLHRRRVSRTITGTRDDAEALERLLGANEQGVRRTVVDAVDRYLVLKYERHSPETRRNYRGARDRYIATHPIGDARLDQLTFEQLEDFYLDLRNEDRAPRTVLLVHRLISASCKAAVKAHWIATNPAAHADPPSVEQAVSEPYELADVARIVAVADEDVRDVIQCAIASGARRGELAALRWRDVDFTTATLAFHGTVSRVEEGAGMFRKPTKTGRPRTLTVDAACIAMLEARYARTAAQAVAARVSPERLDRVAVFSRTLEDHFTSGNRIGHAFYRTAKAAGVKMRFHDLRHLSCSEMTAGGVPVTAGTRRAGHASTKMFFDVYGHARADADQHATEVLAQTWAAITTRASR
jgi:integrase